MSTAFEVCLLVSAKPPLPCGSQRYYWKVGRKWSLVWHPCECMHVNRWADTGGAGLPGFSLWVILNVSCENPQNTTIARFQNSESVMFSEHELSLFFAGPFPLQCFAFLRVECS